ncbi:MAG: GntR family transcriptional regulator [Candidatus Saccharimonadales bacterium]
MSKKRLDERKQTHAVMRNQILSGVWEPGQHTTECKIAEHIQKPRGAVREALAVLEATGAVRQVPNPRGVEVRQITRTEALGSIALRYRLEVSSAQYEDPIDTTKKSPRELYAATVDLAEAYRAGEQAEFMLADTRFHVELMRLRGYSASVTALQGFRDKIQMYRVHNELPLTELQMTTVVDEHHTILSALEGGEPLIGPLHQHLASTRARIES